MPAALLTDSGRLRFQFRQFRSDVPSGLLGRLQTLQPFSAGLAGLGKTLLRVRPVAIACLEYRHQGQRADVCTGSPAAPSAPCQTSWRYCWFVVGDHQKFERVFFHITLLGYCVRNASRPLTLAAASDCCTGAHVGVYIPPGL